MRTRIWILGITALAIGILLVLFRAAKHEQPISHETATTVTNQPVQPEQPKIAEHHQITNIAQIATTLPPMTPFANALVKTNPVAALRLAAWQTPIEFYGKVIDENSNPVAGATISLHWVEIPTEEGNRTTNAESDAEGLFSLYGQRGPSLSVLVSKEGYYSRRGGAKYGPFANPDFSPDARNPVIFNLRKKGQGAELITSENGIRLKVDVRPPKNGTPVRVDFFRKQASATGQLEISQNKPPWKEATEWSFRMSIPDGGFVENEEEIQFEAPETNYKPSVEYHFTKGETNWTTQVTKQFYIAFGKPRKYGWLRIESNLAQETIFLTYAINPSGSRNLEPVN